MLFLVLTAATLEENLREVNRFRASIDGVEVRADYLADPEGEDWPNFFRRLSLPAILTLRKPGDGGRYRASEVERGELFRRLLETGGFSYVDLEGDSDLPGAEEAARAGGVIVVRSFHDFEGVPKDLVERIEGLPRNPEELPKAAVMPRSCRDLERILLAFEALKGRKKILLGMGEFGFPTRVLASRLGSYLTFASPGGDRVAPGLVDPETLDEVYRYHRIGPETRIFGIVGNPIMHSRSPHIHNPAYDRLGLDAVYVPFHVDRLSDFSPISVKLGIGGLSVTVPFKEDVIPLCASVEEAVRVIGACNTVVLGPEGFKGYNTDAEGFLAPLRKIFGPEIGAARGKGFLSGLSAGVVGAGGAARSVVYALAKEGASVLVLNRTEERARRLAADISAALGLPAGRIAWGGLGAAGAGKMEAYRDLLVQTTTRGMHPWEGEDPFPEYRFAGRELVYDIVYNPRETCFLRRALSAGCRVVYGEEMLLHQAYRQFYLFTGREYPKE